MQTLTEIVAAVVLQTTAAAYSHFGVTVEARPAALAQPAPRAVARTAPARPRAPVRLQPAAACPEIQPPDATGRV